MIELRIHSIEELAGLMVSCAEDGKFTVAALHFDDATELFLELIKKTECDISLLDIEDPEFYSYELEYYVTLTEDGYISVEKAYCEDRYLKTLADILFVSEFASDKLIESNEEADIICSFYFEYEGNDSCDHGCPICGFSEDVDCVESCDEISIDIPSDFSEAELIFDEEYNIVGAKVRSDELFRYLFGF